MALDILTIPAFSAASVRLVKLVICLNLGECGFSHLLLQGYSASDAGIATALLTGDLLLEDIVTKFLNRRRIPLVYSNESSVAPIFICKSIKSSQAKQIKNKPSHKQASYCQQIKQATLIVGSSIAVRLDRGEYVPETLNSELVA